MSRQHKTMFVLAGVAALAVPLILIWCPPAVCRALNLHTSVISTLNDYRQFVTDENTFYSMHRTRAVRIDCATLRDEVVTALETGRLALGPGRPEEAQHNGAGQGSIEAWHQGRLLHLTQRALKTDDEQQAWATTIRVTVAAQQGQDLAFLSRLFGGLVLHVAHKQIPIVLFSDHPCV